MTLSSLKECENELRVVRGIHWSGKAAAAAAVVVCVTHPPHPHDLIQFPLLQLSSSSSSSHERSGNNNRCSSILSSLSNTQIDTSSSERMNERTNERGGEGGRGVKGSENSPLKCQGLFTTAAAAVEEEEEGGRRGRIVKEFMNVSTVSKSWSRDREKRTWTSGKSKMHSRAHF